MSNLSVVMCIYSEPSKMIRKAIESIISQHYSDFEFIIVNDNPRREENVTLLAEYSAIDHRIRIINNHENIGLTKSLNKAISMSSGKYIARMDADDIADINRFKIQLLYLEQHSDIDVCGSNVFVIDESDNITGRFCYPSSSEKIKSKLFFRDCICHPSVIFRKSFYDSLNGYSEDFSKAQDYDLWVRGVMENKEFHNIQLPLLSYRMHDSNISTVNVDEQKKYAFNAKLKLYSWATNKNSAKLMISTIDGYDKKSNIISVVLKFIYLSKFLSKNINSFSYVFFYTLTIKRLLYVTLIRLSGK